MKNNSKLIVLFALLYASILAITTVAGCTGTRDMTSGSHSDLSPDSSADSHSDLPPDLSADSHSDLPPDSHPGSNPGSPTDSLPDPHPGSPTDSHLGSHPGSPTDLLQGSPTDSLPDSHPGSPTDSSPVMTSREITDMAGRIIKVPDRIDSVFSTDPVSAIYLYTLAPDKLLGWNYELNETERSVILEKYHSLPNFGMGDAINYETVIAANPTIALNVSAINAGTIDACDKLAAKLGIPVVMVSNRLEDATAVYRFLGDLFDMKEQAERLAAYTEKTFADISDKVISSQDKVRIYYGNGEDSLETAPAGSTHGQIIDMVNAINAADLEIGEGSFIRISPEQLLTWDPDVIIVIGEAKINMSGSAAANSILVNKNYATLKAVKNEMVFGVPNAPFNWVDRPTGPNRIVGIRWLSKKIYPDYFDFNIDDEVREFFQLFYHVELNNEQLLHVYNGF
ncbi:MAG: ABC transporter substrate-binding protein [Synergistaceae bacterium]|nr:ABC transporter substrate-binding protein [Synergistaceae bacterium]